MSQFQRLEQMVGKDGLARLQRSFVVVVGLGAVGSYATEALARAGIGRLRLIDYDEVRPSNINRQLFATWKTVGQKKSDVACARVQSINPSCRLEILDMFVHKDTVSHVIAPAQSETNIDVSTATHQLPDFVIDAIDPLTPKIELITALQQANIRFVSSMGAALRTDPSMVRVGKLSEVTYCPLAAIVRKYLRRRNAPVDFDCVYSPEPVRHLRRDAVLPPEESEPNFLERGRKRATLGSLPTLTGIFGLTAANHAIMKILWENTPNKLDGYNLV